MEGYTGKDRETGRSCTGSGTGQRWPGLEGRGGKAEMDTKQDFMLTAEYGNGEK